MTDARPVPKLMVSPEDAASMLSVHRDTVLRWVKQGKLPATKLTPRIMRIRVADIETFIAQSAA